MTKCVFLKGPDSHWGHEARTSKEVNVRDQQDALNGLATGLQAGETLVFPQRLLYNVKYGYQYQCEPAY